MSLNRSDSDKRAIVYERPAIGLELVNHDLPLARRWGHDTVFDSVARQLHRSLSDKLESVSQEKDSASLSYGAMNHT